MSNPLERFLCRWFKTDSLYDIEWYPQNAIRTSDTGRLITTNMDIPLTPECNFADIQFDPSKMDHFPMPQDYNGPPIPAIFQPSKKRAYQGQPIDVNNVCFQRIIGRGYDNSNNTIDIGIKCNTLQREMVRTADEFETTRAAGFGQPQLAHVKMFCKAGESNRHLEENQLAHFYQPNPTLCSSNIAWVKCLTLLTHENMDNYVVKIPFEVCFDQTKWAHATFKSPQTAQKHELPAYPDEIKDKEGGIRLCRCWYAVPLDHILATPCLAPESLLIERGMRCKVIKYRRGNEPIRGFVVMTDATLEDIKNDFIEQWFTRRDIRPLTSLSFQAVPIRKEETVKGPVELNVTLSYMGWPALSVEQSKRLVPTSTPEFALWLHRAVYDTPQRKEQLRQLLTRK